MSAPLTSVSEAALRAVLAAGSLADAHAAARDGLDAIAPHNLLDMTGAVEVTGWSRGHLRKVAAEGRIGIKHAGAWHFQRDRLFRRLSGGAA